MFEEHVGRTVSERLLDSQVSTEGGHLSHRGKIAPVSGDIKVDVVVLFVGGNGNTVILFRQHGKSVDQRAEELPKPVARKSYGRKRTEVERDFPWTLPSHIEVTGNVDFF